MVTCFAFCKNFMDFHSINVEALKGEPLISTPSIPKYLDFLINFDYLSYYKFKVIKNQI
jgi:hypothetical protein